MNLPTGNEINFMIIGAAKCATTWLQLSLSKSPKIYMPGPELHFFSREYDRGIDWYLEQFEVSNNERLIGEKSNSYLTHPEAAKRIALHCPNTRLIVQMRDPVARAYSDYCMLFRRGEVTRNIHDYLDPSHAAGLRFLNGGRYAHHLSRFYDLISADRILLLAFENVETAPHKLIEKVATHIGLTDDLGSSVEDRVKDKTKPVVPPLLRAALKPLRPFLDPVRNTLPIETLRDAVAREVQYPDLPKDLEARMIEFFRSDRELLMNRIPEINNLWLT